MEHQHASLASSALGSRVRGLLRTLLPEKRRSRSARPSVEVLETKSLLSHGPAVSLARHAIGVHAAAVERASATNEFPYSGLGAPKRVALSQVPTNPFGVPGKTPPTGYRGVAVVGGKLVLYLDVVVNDNTYPAAITPYKALPDGRIQKLGSFGVYKGLTNNGTDFSVYTGTPVVDWFPGRVVWVVKNWTPATGGPDGNEVVVRTIEPNGIIFYVRYSHLLGGKYLPLKVGDALPASQFTVVGRAGHTGVPAAQSTTYSITAWTPQFGGRFLGPAFNAAISPVSVGVPPDFVDLDPNPDGSIDDPDNDADDPGGFSGSGPNGN